MQATPYDAILEKVKAGDSLRTPDRSAGKPFVIEAIDPEGLTVRTFSGGRVKVSTFTFDTAFKYLSDRGVRGENWIKAGDPDFQMLLDMENDRVRAASYVLAILERAGLIDIDGRRPNRVRLRL